MPAGITIFSDNTQYVRSVFREYVKFNKRNVESLWQDTSRKLATDLYVETAAIAPTKAEITADVKALGWKIPTKFPDGRMGRGTPAMWEGFGYIRAAKRILRGKRGRRAAADQAKIDKAVARQNKLKAMQAFVIAARTHARLYLASGWLGAVFDLGGSIQAKQGIVDHERGGAIVRRSAGKVEVTFWNRTPGIETMQAKRDFVGRAVARRIADMWVYIDRKRAEAAQLLRGG